MYAVTICLLNGCDNKSVPDSHSPASTSVQQKRSITLLTWDDYYDPAVLQEFTASTGIEVKTEAFDDTDTVEAAVRAEPSRYDVIIFEGNKVEKFHELGLAKDLDRSLLPQLNNIDAKYLDLNIDPHNQVSVPYLWGTTLVAYRKDLIPDPATSWNLLWDPRYHGKVAMLNERQETVHIALIKNGYSMNSRDSDAMDAAEGDLLDQVSKMGVRFVEGIPKSIEKGLGTGELWAMTAYSGDAAMVAAEDDRIGLLLPEEGAALWMDNFIISRQSRRSDEAHAFINFMLTPEIAAKNANYLHYATPNKKAMPLLNPELRNDKNIFPSEEVLARCEFAGSLTPARERPVNAVWQRVMSAYQQRNPQLDTEITEVVSDDQ